MLQNAKHAKRKLNEVQVWCLRCQTQRNCCWKKFKHNEEMQTQTQKKFYCKMQTFKEET